MSPHDDIIICIPIGWHFINPCKLKQLFSCNMFAVSWGATLVCAPGSAGRYCRSISTYTINIKYHTWVTQQQQHRVHITHTLRWLVIIIMIMITIIVWSPAGRLQPRPQPIPAQQLQCRVPQVHHVLSVPPLRFSVPRLGESGARAVGEMINGGRVVWG